MRTSDKVAFVAALGMALGTMLMIVGLIVEADGLTEAGLAMSCVGALGIVASGDGRRDRWRRG